MRNCSIRAFQSQLRLSPASPLIIIDPFLEEITTKGNSTVRDQLVHSLIMIKITSTAMKNHLPPQRDSHTKETTASQRLKKRSQMLKKTEWL